MSDKTMYTCPLCKLTIDTLSQFERHLKSKNHITKYIESCVNNDNEIQPSELSLADSTKMIKILSNNNKILIEERDMLLDELIESRDEMRRLYRDSQDITPNIINYVIQNFNSDPHFIIIKKT